MCDPDRQLQYRNQRHGPGDHIDLAMVVLFAIEWLLRRIFRTARTPVGGLSGVSVAVHVSRPTGAAETGGRRLSAS